MTDEEVEEFLLDQRVGRVGCRDGEGTYVVPVIYAWHEGCAYAFTTEGKKSISDEEYEVVSSAFERYLTSPTAAKVKAARRPAIPPPTTIQ